ncbi:MAG: DUF3473 domain-containing protein [Myxococcales bacterium]|nr:DUF3473 domain-containing protein [Myxococcales bacterium]
MNEPTIRNVLTVDVEDYFHVENLAPYIRPEEWDGLREVCPDAVRRLLALLAEHQVRATFFVLGWIARRHPDLVRVIDAAGHEVGCHGTMHQPVDRLTPAEFRQDLHEAAQRLADLLGKPVQGYRAPNFSIGPANPWALDILLDEGFTYDSSLFPGRKVPVGYLGADRAPVLIRREGHGDLVELPLARLDYPGGSLPFAGGGYFRLYPYALIRAGLRRINRRHRVPAVIYFHPWEIVPDQPRVAAGARARFKHYTGLATFESKLRRLLGDFSFGPAGDLAATIQAK